MTDTSFARLLAEKRVLVCVGSGGVGKTTSAAALGMAAALAGKRTLVLTIDPAKRLANALGLGEIGNQASLISLAGVAPNDHVTGSLSAMMLDMKQTFDDMVREYSSEEQRRRIAQNRLYQSMSEALAGIQEYMAVAKLFDVMKTNLYDIIILDTPPTAHALDFLDAPARFMQFLDNDGLQWLIKTSGAASQLGLRLLDLGTTYIVRTLGRFTGLDVIREIGEFISAFQPLFQGFRARAQKIEALLASHELGFVVVTAPTKPQVDEAIYFQKKLRDEHMRLDGLVVNRIHPRLPDNCLSTDAEDQLAREMAPAAAAEAIRAAIEYNQAAMMEERQLERLRASSDGIELVTIAELDHDVHDLVSLYDLMRQLVD